MKLEVFKEIIRLLEKHDKSIHKIYEAGIDLTNIQDDLHVIINHLIGSIYGKEGLETFNWWCYDKEWGCRDDLDMTDTDGNILCQTIEDLHAYLEENADDTYDLPQKMSSSERLELLKQMFS